MQVKMSNPFGVSSKTYVPVEFEKVSKLPVSFTIKVIVRQLEEGISLEEYIACLDKLLKIADFDKERTGAFLCQVTWWWVPETLPWDEREVLEDYYRGVVQSALRCFNINLDGSGFENQGNDNDPCSDNFRRLFWCLLARKMFSDLLQEVKDYNQLMFPV